MTETNDVAEPRIIETASGTVEVFWGVFVTVNWEAEPHVTERLIYVAGADRPSVILRPKSNG